MGARRFCCCQIGTGIPKAKEKLGDIFDDACQALWLNTHKEVFTEAMFRTDMTHYYLASIFPGLSPADNYLRIEVYIVRFCA